MLITAIAAMPASGTDLMAAYELALQNDPQLQQALSNLSSVQESRPLAKSRLLPNLSLSGQLNAVNREIKGGFSPSGTDDYSEQSLSLSLLQPIYHRDYWITLEQADHSIARAEADYQSAQIDLMARTTTAYFNVLSASDDLRVSQAQLEATRRQLDQAQQRFDVGLIAITDVHEAQATYDRDRAGAIQAENALDSAWEALLEITGSNRSTLAPLGDEMVLNRPQPDNIADWSETAQLQNFAIIAARNATELARKTIDVNKSGHYPTLDLVGSYGLHRTDSDTGSDADTGIIGLQLNVPLYTGGSTSSSIRQAEADFRTAQFALDQQRRAVGRQVRDAYRGVISSISQVDALKAATISADSALKSTNAGYEVGTRTIVDVLTVQRNLFDSQRNYFRSRYDYIINSLSLKQAAGTLSRKDLEQVNRWLQ